MRWPRPSSLLAALGLLLLLLAAPAWAQTTFDTVASNHAFNGCPAGGTSITVGAGVTNRALVASVAIQGSSTVSVSSMGGGGGSNSWTKLNRATGGTNGIEIWSLIGGTTGAQTITVTLSGAISTECLVVVWSYGGVDQVTPVASYQSNSVDPPSVTMVTATGDGAVAMWYGTTASTFVSECGTGGLAPGTNDGVLNSNAEYEWSHCVNVSGASNTISWTHSGTNSVMNGAAVKAAATATGAPSRTLTGAGT